MSLPIFAFQVDYSLGADVFVGASLFATTAGYLIVRGKPGSAPTAYPERNRDILLSKLLGVFGIVGCLLLLLDAQSRGTVLSVAYLLDNLNSIRAAGFEALESPGSGTPTALVGSLLAPCSLLSVIAAARFGRLGGRWFVALGAANFILVGIVGLLVYAGRSTLFFAAFLVLISLYIGGKRILALRLKTLLIAGAAVAGVWYFSVSWVETRQGSFSPERTLAVTQRAQYKSWIAPIARSDHAVGVGLVSLGYFASPLPTLAFYLQQGSVPGPFWGRYSFPLPARAAETVIGTEAPRRWIDVRHEVFAPLEGAGYFGNVYATWLRDLVIDFGYVGAVLFCALFGAFMAWARNAFERTGAVHYHWLQVLACFTLGFGAFAGVLFFAFVSVPFIVAVAIAIWSAMLQPTSGGRKRGWTAARYRASADVRR
jgi:hypothetical protein